MTGNLPEDVLGLCAIQDNLLTGVNTESSRYLEDPDIRCCTREGDITCYSNIARRIPSVGARGKVLPAESSTTHVKIGGTSSWCSVGSINVCSFHIDCRCIQQARSYYTTCRTSSIARVYCPCHFCLRYTDGSSSDWISSNISSDTRCGDICNSLL